MGEINVQTIRSVIEDIAKSCDLKHFNTNFKEETFSGDNYLSRIVRVKVVDEINEENKVNLLIKFNNMKEKDREAFPAQVFFEREVDAYENVLPKLCEYQNEMNVPENERFKFAKTYKTSVEWLKEYLIMEDLSPLGYEVYGKYKSMDYEHSKVVLRNLASFHAASFAMKKLDLPRFLKLKENITTKNNYPDIIYPMLTSITESIIPYLEDEKHQDSIKNVVDNRVSIMSRCLDSDLTEPYNVICHGDLWSNNTLFKGTKNVIFVDYQFMRYASPATDFVYNLYMSSSASFWQNNIDKLSDEYYKYLAEHLDYYGCDVKELYPRKEFDKHIEQCVPYGIFFGLLGCKLIVGKAGEEMKLEEFNEDKNDVTCSPTEEMLERLRGYAEDAIKYKKYLY